MPGGPSGAWKGTLIRELVAGSSLGHDTRAAARGERPASLHDDFTQRVARGKFLAVRRRLRPPL